MIHGRWLLAWQSMSLQVGQVVLGLWRQGKRRRRLRHPPQDPQLATLKPSAAAQVAVQDLDGWAGILLPAAFPLSEYA